MFKFNYKYYNTYMSKLQLIVHFIITTTFIILMFLTGKWGFVIGNIIGLLIIPTFMNTRVEK